MQATTHSISIKTRIIHMFLFELFGIVIFAPFAALILNENILKIGTLGITISVIAMVWNFIYNIIFDKVEANLGKNRFKRSPIIRALHALLFEGGLLIVTVPIVAIWLKMTLLQAFITDIAFVVFYLVYAYVYNWCFDKSYLYLIKKYA
ncbi:PACE efflux transporter [Thiotrichales bacterium 19S3-7]|nr:PACE efflux transporter [Thiotrichales bacterium 19S3-7]MCF6801531.1 PACE efflux transporter [Thiotrichales bacterium 19S3-11]